jgi:hypothetical protein
MQPACHIACYVYTSAYSFRYMRRVLPWLQGQHISMLLTKADNCLYTSRAEKATDKKILISVNLL